MNTDTEPTTRAAQERRTAAALPLVDASDPELARMVRTSVRQLACHSERYAALFCRCPGVVLAREFNTGMVERATPIGRAAMREAHLKCQAALAVPTDWDGNTVRRITKPLPSAPHTG